MREVLGTCHAGCTPSSEGKDTVPVDHWQLLQNFTLAGCMHTVNCHAHLEQHCRPPSHALRVQFKKKNAKHLLQPCQLLLCSAYITVTYQCMHFQR